MNFFNAQRDNIYVSSSKYDVVTLRSVKAQYHHSSEDIIPENKPPPRSQAKQEINSKKRAKSTQSTKSKSTKQQQSK